jgi:hypothetical protein
MALPQWRHMALPQWRHMALRRPHRLPLLSREGLLQPPTAVTVGASASHCGRGRGEAGIRQARQRADTGGDGGEAGPARRGVRGRDAAGGGPRSQPGPDDMGGALRPWHLQPAGPEYDAHLGVQCCEALISSRSLRSGSGVGRVRAPCSVREGATRLPLPSLDPAPARQCLPQAFNCFRSLACNCVGAAVSSTPGRHSGAAVSPASRRDSVSRPGAAVSPASP